MSALAITIIIAAGYLAGASVAYAVALDVIPDSPEGEEPYRSLYVSRTEARIAVAFAWLLAAPILAGSLLHRLTQKRRAAKELPRAEVRK